MPVPKKLRSMKRRETELIRQIVELIAARQGSTTITMPVADDNAQLEVRVEHEEESDEDA